MPKNSFSEFPDRTELLDWYNTHGSNQVHLVNINIRSSLLNSTTPSIHQEFESANRMSVKVLGINDPYTVAGFEEFNNESLNSGYFPIFGIGLSAIMKEELRLKLKINDPDKAGRLFLNGKGIDFPINQEGPLLKKLEPLQISIQKKGKAVFDLIKQHLTNSEINKIFCYDSFLEKYAPHILTEDFLIVLLVQSIFSACPESCQRIQVLTDLFHGTPPESDVLNSYGVTNEIRRKILKKGGIAYIEEDYKNSPDFEEIAELIIDAGGIPTYPVLLDDEEGNYTDFERNMENLQQRLEAMNLFSLELFPSGNDADRLKEFALFFHDKGFIISLGTRSFIDQSESLIPKYQDGLIPDEELNRINFEGACLIGAHQYLRSRGEEGYVEKNGKIRLQDKDKMIELGNAVIEFFLQNQ